LNRLIIHWIVSSESLISDETIHHSLNRIRCESIHHSLNRIIKPSDLHWINSTKGWIASFFILGSLELIHICIESYHYSCVFDLYFCCLNRFTHLVNQFTMLFLCENLLLSLLTIYSLLLITLKWLNHLQLFSIGLKNSLHINSSRLNTFSWNHFVHWVPLIF